MERASRNWNSVLKRTDFILRDPNPEWARVVRDFHFPHDVTVRVRIGEAVIDRFRTELRLVKMPAVVALDL
jgi:hypothetical protein